MAEKNILEQLLGNKPNANQFDFLNKKGIPKKVCPESSCQKKDYGGNPKPDKTHSVV
jgi:hypothetical protein